jgi:hypothetical protein
MTLPCSQSLKVYRLADSGLDLLPIGGAQHSHWIQTYGAAPYCSFQGCYHSKGSMASEYDLAPKH